MNKYGHLFLLHIMELLGYFQNDLISSYVSLSNQSQTFRYNSGLHRTLGRDDSFAGEPLPEGLDGQWWWVRCRGEKRVYRERGLETEGFWTG
ncbi:unnamed protein product [Camellia sinensis]